MMTERERWEDMFAPETFWLKLRRLYWMWRVFGWPTKERIYFGDEGNGSYYNGSCKQTWRSPYQWNLPREKSVRPFYS